MRSIWYGQLSGLVEPIAGVLGALLVSVVVPILPYSLAFAAGAMVYVVVDDIIPEAQSRSVDLFKVNSRVSRENFMNYIVKSDYNLCKSKV